MPYSEAGWWLFNWKQHSCLIQHRKFPRDLEFLALLVSRWLLTMVAAARAAYHFCKNCRAFPIPQCPGFQGRPWVSNTNQEMYVRSPEGGLSWNVKPHSHLSCGEARLHCLLSVSLADRSVIPTAGQEAPLSEPPEHHPLLHYEVDFISLVVSLAITLP